MKKNTNRVRLSETQLHRVIKESVNKILNENTFGTENNKTYAKKLNRTSLKQYFQALNAVRQGLNQIKDMADYRNPRINQEYWRKWNDRLSAIEEEINDLALSMSSNFDNQNTNYVPGNRKTSARDGQDELNANIFNPYTQKYETMNVTKAAMIMNKLFKETDENLENMGGYRDKYGDIGFGLNSCDMDYVKSYGPVRALEYITADVSEPEDWYERNEHGDFDNY